MHQIGNVASQETSQHIGAFSLFKAKFDYLDAINKNIDNATSNLIDPRLFAVLIADKDTMHYGDTMKAEDSDELKKAMCKEVEDLTKIAHEKSSVLLRT